MMPARIQLSRAKGFRLQEASQKFNGLLCVKVDRTTKFGNPFRVGEIVHFGPCWSGRDERIEDAEHACRLYRRWLFNLRSAVHTVAPLRGKNLACWCPPDAACHADVLLELANAEPNPASEQSQIIGRMRRGAAL